MAIGRDASMHPQPDFYRVNYGQIHKQRRKQVRAMTART
jgi:hypothetical protein